MKSLEILCAVGLVGLGAMDVYGGDACVFTCTNGDWSTSDCWTSCSGSAPGCDDTATIGNGKTCTVSDLLGVCIVAVTVDSGGVLKIDEGKLIVNGSGSTSSTVNGTLLFAGSSNTPTLRIDDTLTINGSGTIDGRDTDGAGGYEKAYLQIDDAETLTIGSGLTLVGSIWVSSNPISGPSGSDTAALRVDGTLAVDGADDWMLFNDGSCDETGIKIYGTGSVDVSDGLLEFVNTLNGSGVFSTTLSWFLSGGTIEIGMNSHFFEMSDNWTISGGTLNVEDRPFCTTGSLTWTGGMIHVQADSCARFGMPGGTCGEVEDDCTSDDFTLPSCD